MGSPYKQVDSLSHLPPTIVSSRPPSDLHTRVDHVLCTQVYGAYTEKVYRQITPTKAALNETVTTPAECATLVRRDYPTATAAEYSNVGGDWCSAVFEA